MTAYMGYNNLIPLGTVTADELPGFEKENAYDWFTYTWWQSSTQFQSIYQIDFDYFNVNPDFSEGFEEDDTPNGWTNWGTITETEYFTAHPAENRIEMTAGLTGFGLAQTNYLTPGTKYYYCINIHELSGELSFYCGDLLATFNAPGIYSGEFVATVVNSNIRCGAGDSAILNSHFIFENDYSANYFGMAAHNLNTLFAGAIAVQYYDGEDWQDFLYVIRNNMIGNAPIFHTADTILSASWRFVFYYDTEAPFVGVLSLGMVKEFPEGIRPEFVPPPIAFDSKIFNSESVTGQFLGRSIERFGYKINIKQTLVDPDWMLENWPEVAQALQTQPFFWCWNFEQYPDHTVYAWLDGDLPRANYTDPRYMAFNFDCRALHLIRWF